MRKEESQAYFVFDAFGAAGNMRKRNKCRVCLGALVVARRPDGRTWTLECPTHGLMGPATVIGNTAADEAGERQHEFMNELNQTGRKRRDADDILKELGY